MCHSLYLCTGQAGSRFAWTCWCYRRLNSKHIICATTLSCCSKSLGKFDDGKIWKFNFLVSPFCSSWEKFFLSHDESFMRCSELLTVNGWGDDDEMRMNDLKHTAGGNHRSGSCRWSNWSGNSTHTVGRRTRFREVAMILIKSLLFSAKKPHSSFVMLIPGCDEEG